MSNGYTIALTPAASAPWWLPLLAEGITIALTSLVIVCEMCELQDHRADDVFVRELGSADPRHRELAARAVGELGLSSETARLRTLLHDPEEAVAAEAARSLGLLGDSESAPEIARLADRGDDETREYVANSLARLTHSAAREKLRVLLDDHQCLFESPPSVLQATVRIASPFPG